ncbi:MAG: DUF3078 domain-containing protein [Candidatus Eisenbacteria bacterium]|nr:DUF3078 domain-containing protein [Candidatus Eisenbacteria bacterium]MCC7143447.1 DUF3078 domain-containing protein [Candidatus Eisenbacteria bacterium]
MSLSRAIILAAFSTLAITHTANAEDPPPPPSDHWNVLSDIKYTITQSAYSDNWTGGEAGSISWTLGWNTLSERMLSPKFVSRNTAKLAFGQTHTQNKETKDWASPAKSTDLIDIESLGRFPLGKFVDPFVALRLESQFVDASDPSKTRIVNPMLLTESAGVARVIEHAEDRDWTVRLGAAARQRIDRDVPIEIVSGEVTKRETETTNDFGLTFVSDRYRPLSKTIKWENKLTVFQALVSSAKDDLEGTDRADDWKATDFNLENTFTADIAKFLVVSLYNQLLYDKEIDKGGRFKSTLGAGLTYKLAG